MYSCDLLSDMCTYIYTHMLLYMYVCIYTHTYMYSYMYACISAYIQCMYKCVYTCNLCKSISINVFTTSDSKLVKVNILHHSQYQSMLLLIIEIKRYIRISACTQLYLYAHSYYQQQSPKLHIIHVPS